MRSDENAIRLPSGDHAGSRASPASSVTARSSLPSAFMVQICQVLVRYAWKAIFLPSGDQEGWRASIAMSVTALARPPAAGSVQIVPSRSIAIVLPSGDIDAAIDVPSCSVR